MRRVKCVVKFHQMARQAPNRINSTWRFEKLTVRLHYGIHFIVYIKIRETGQQVFYNTSVNALPSPDLRFDSHRELICRESKFLETRPTPPSAPARPARYQPRMRGEVSDLYTRDNEDGNAHVESGYAKESRYGDSRDLIEQEALLNPFQKYHTYTTPYEENIAKLAKYDLKNKNINELMLKNRFKLSIFLTLLLLASFFISVVILQRFHSSLEFDDDVDTSGGVTHKPTKSPTFQPQTSLNFSIAAENEYGNTLESTFNYTFLSQGNSILLEPYKDTTISIITDGDTDDSCEYSFVVEISDAVQRKLSSSGSKNKWTGDTSSHSFSLTLQTVGDYSLDVRDCYGDDIASYTVYVRYVRRELLTLTETDREDFLDAFATLWTTNTVDGKELYGERYRSLYNLALLHNDAGANKVCDEFHGGPGFAQNHFLLSSYLEQSLQLVNPKVCLHYMEYASYFDPDGLFASHITNQLDTGNWTTLLTETFFGSSDPTTGQITSGRWAGLALPYINSEFYVNEDIDPNSTWFPEEEDVWFSKGVNDTHMVSPYGLLRSPWNFNPYPYTTRFNNVNLIASLDGLDKGAAAYYRGVYCTTVVTFIENIIDMSFATFLATVEDDVHGIVHFTFGGAGGTTAKERDDELLEKFDLDENDLIFIAITAQVFYKSLFNLDWITYEAINGTPFFLNCTRSLYSTSYPGSGDNGAPYCIFSEYYYEDEEKLNLLICKLFQADDRFGSCEPDSREGSYFKKSYTKIYYDMTFEDKVDFIRIMDGRYQFDGEMGSSGAPTDPLFWVVHGSVERLMQLNYMEGLSSDYIYDYTQPTDQVCSGHAAESTKYWLTGFYFMDESVDPASLTNAELQNVLDPRSDEYGLYINYIYDSRSFAYCDDLDYLGFE